MDNQVRLPSEETSELSYMELMAYFGVTTHPVGRNATRELAKLCQIGKGEYVLDVDCSVGQTPVIFAKQQSAGKSLFQTLPFSLAVAP